MFVLKCSGSVVIGDFSSLKFKTQYTFSSEGCCHSGPFEQYVNPDNEPTEWNKADNEPID